MTGIIFNDNQNDHIHDDQDNHIHDNEDDHHHDLIPPGGNVPTSYNDEDDHMYSWAYQHIPTSHIPTKWEYVIIMKGGEKAKSHYHHVKICHL